MLISLSSIKKYHRDNKNHDVLLFHGTRKNNVKNIMKHGLIVDYGFTDEDKYKGWNEAVWFHPLEKIYWCLHTTFIEVIIPVSWITKIYGFEILVNKNIPPKNIIGVYPRKDEDTIVAKWKPDKHSFGNVATCADIKRLICH